MGCGVLANKCSCSHGAQINFGDLTPYLTWGGSSQTGGNEDCRREAAMRRSKEKNEKRESGGEERKLTKSERGKERVN
jgi:hypothetical protein